MTRYRTTTALFCVLLLSSAASSAVAQPQGENGLYSDSTVKGSILEPRPIEISDDAELASHIKVPDGFEVEVVARDLVNPRMIAVADDGTVYVTRRSVGDVIRLNDADGDGKYEDFTVVAGRPGMHGMAIDGDTAYLVSVNDVYTAPIQADGTLGELTRIIDDLPDAGQHANRTIAIGPDGMLYITVGSTCNECEDPNPENATVLRAGKDGKSRTIFATGLRNTIGFGWQPETGELYGADHGIDWLGDEAQQEEFNHIEQGKDYGWPYTYDFSNSNPRLNPTADIPLEQLAEMSVEPVVGYTPHSAPMQMAFYTGTAFPADYSGDAFVAMRGSWNRRPPSGYEITRIHFEDGKPVAWERFAEGLLIEAEDGGYGFLGRPAGLAVTPEGALLFSDDTNGVLYRISYTGADTLADAISTSPPDVTGKPAPSDIAIDLVEPSSDDKLSVTASFADGETIPIAHAAMGHNASPKLSWTGAPADAKSYVVLAEDPNAKMPKPFVHWIAFDIGAQITQLPEGLATDPVLVEPEDVKQGTNSMGSTGYTGPKPPLDDPAHHYHFQVFALDIASLGLDPGAKRADVLAALKGHVLAAGEVVGLYDRPAPERAEN
ncbi:YbhB/YbcL family Raf kinase inhibitor-like protein [uncultured Devosia sp.]|uniref:YbhB/YbcL family Raf kinase inhibitor-like protein n=1 Tax=uncultured Devosia sp. TaxID=211434 RepID=UPI0035CC504F